MIKAYILDLNGIFLHSEYLSNRMNQRWNVPVEESLEALKTIIDISRFPKAPRMFSLWKPYFERWNIDINEDEFFKWWFSGEILQEDVIQFCKKVRESGKRVYILSNNFKERTKFYRSNFPEIFDNTDKAYFSWETGFVKPNVEALQNVLKENKLKAGEVVYVDDSFKNIESAKSLGITSYGSFTEIQNI